MSSLFSTTSPHAHGQRIQSLLESLDGSNSESLFRDLCESADGADGSCLLLRTCFDICGAKSNDIHLDPAIVSQLFRYLFVKPNFSTLFCQYLRSEAIEDGFLDNLSDALGLSNLEKIAIGLALLNSEKLETRTCGKSFCMSQIEGLLADPTALRSAKQIQQILMFLRQSEDLSKHVNTFIRMLNSVPWKGNFPCMSVPLPLNESEEACLFKDLCYGCTDDAKNCKHILSLLSPLTVPTISRIMGTVACAHGGILEGQIAYPMFRTSDPPLLSSKNINVLVDSIKELAPDTNWVHVMKSLDYEGFYIPDEGAFNCLMSTYKLSCQDPFPFHSICGSVWKNAQGQLSFLKHAVSSSAEVVNFSHSARQLKLLDSIQDLKLESRFSNYAWFCLDLLDVLCQLAERGHRDSVQSILDYPLKYCPAVLLLGLAQIKTANNLVQDELSVSILPRVICCTSIHKNGIIMQLWHSNQLLLVRSFVEALTTDADNIARIVDICHEIKILNIVMTKMPFRAAIKLAVSAFNKELLDLEKWLSENLLKYGDMFFEECLNYLKDIQFGTFQRERLYPLNVRSQAKAIAVFLKVLGANYQLLIFEGRGPPSNDNVWAVHSVAQMEYWELQSQQKVKNSLATFKCGVKTFKWNCSSVVTGLGVVAAVAALFYFSRDSAKETQEEFVPTMRTIRYSL